MNQRHMGGGRESVNYSFFQSPVCFPVKQDGALPHPCVLAAHGSLLLCMCVCECWYEHTCAVRAFQQLSAYYRLSLQRCNGPMGIGFGKLANKLTDEWNVKLSPLTC